LNISKDNIISDFILYGIYTDNKFAELVAQLNLHINAERIIMCIMEVDYYILLKKRFDDNQGKLISFTFLNIINELLDNYQRGIVCHEKDSRFILVLSFSDLCFRPHNLRVFFSDCMTE